MLTKLDGTAKGGIVLAIKEEVKLYDYIESGSKIGETLTNEYYYILLKLFYLP